MKLSPIQQSLSVLLTIQQMGSIAQGLSLNGDNNNNNEAPAHAMQSKLIDRCCQVGKDKAIESPKFNCKLAAREALLGGDQSQALSVGYYRLNLAAELLLARDPNFADQCELVLESCCMAHHRTKNCDSGKQLAKSGASCMDVELSKEATIATESFNDCCMSCSLGILAAKNGAQNETSRLSLAARCKLLSPLASSLSGQLYEQTYGECCQENLPRPSDSLLEPGAPIDCSQSNPCSQRCITAGTYDGAVSRLLERDRCECFAGYKLAADRVNCVDIDECRLGLHSCDKKSEICDNTRGSFRCLARHSAPPARSLFHHQEPAKAEGLLDLEEFQPLRLCPPGSRWNANERSCVSSQFSASGAHQHLLSSRLAHEQTTS